MKAIMLAAGQGTRLRPYTDNLPKCMVPLKGKPLLDWQIETLRACGVDDIIVIKGYQKDKINRPDLRYYVNEQYETTNMVSTLLCAERELEDEVIVLYGDIVFNSSVLNKLLESTNDISVVVDSDWADYWNQRFDNPLDDAESLIMDDKNQISSIGQKTNQREDIQAQYIGLMKFRNQGLNDLKGACSQAKTRSEQGLDLWGKEKKFESLYMTDLLQGMINDGVGIYAVPVKRGWFEVDSISDLEIAERDFDEVFLSKGNCKDGR